MSLILFNILIKSKISPLEPLKVLFEDKDKFENGAPQKSFFTF